MGNKCSCCGYDKNYGSLHFHHLDPLEKEFDWRKLRLKKWESVIEELKKCVVLCANCHSEWHYPQLSKDVYSVENLKDNNRLNYVQASPQSTGLCKECGKEVYGTIHCSTSCARVCRRVVKDRPDKETLEKLVEENSMVKVGKMFNVSDNAIRKWIKQYEKLI